MVHRVEKGGKNSEKGDIMFVVSCGDRVLNRIAGIRSFPQILEMNAKTLGVEEAE